MKLHSMAKTYRTQAEDDDDDDGDSAVFDKAAGYLPSLLHEWVTTMDQASNDIFKCVPFPLHGSLEPPIDMTS